MGVPKDCWDPAPNLYKQISRDQITEDERWETERAESEIGNSPELRIVPELRAKSRLVQNWEFEAKAKTNKYFY